MIECGSFGVQKSTHGIFKQTHYCKKALNECLNTELTNNTKINESIHTFR